MKKILLVLAIVLLSMTRASYSVATYHCESCESCEDEGQDCSDCEDCHE